MARYYYYTLPAFIFHAYDTREAAEAACLSWGLSLHDLSVLCGGADCLVAV